MVKRGDKFSSKNVRLTLRIPDWLIPAIEEYQHDNDVAGSLQQVIISMIMYSSRINTEKKRIRENPQLVQEIIKANDTYGMLDAIYSKNNTEYEVAVLIDAASKYRDIKKGKIVV
jgi:hypothetical protein